MSRSYKKAPVCTDRKHGAKWWKRQANRKVRHHKDVFNNKSYRKVYNPWNIRDWICWESKADAAAWYSKVTSDGWPYNWWLEQYPTFEDYMNKCWEHDFHRK